MNKRNGVAVLVIAVCVVALVVFVSRGAPQVAPTTTGHEAVERSPAEVRDAVPPSEPPAAESQRVPAPAASMPRVRVKVIDADTGAPVAGATVKATPFKLPGGRPRAAAKPGGAAAAPEPASPEPPAVPLTDDHGETEFACAWPGVFLQATTPSGLFGRLTFQKIGSQPLVVEVRADVTLRVKVESRSANTAVGGIPVSVGLLSHDRATPRLKTRNSRRTEATSGIAEFLHVQDWLKQAAGAGRAWIDIPLRHQDAIAITEQDANGPPVVLKLPDTGSVVVRVIGERSGRPIEGVEIKVAAYADAKAPLSVRCTSSWGKGTTDRNGEARVGPVGTGLWIGAWPDGAPDTMFGERSEGPRVDGEERHVVVRMSEDRHVLRGTVVTADGEPWRRTLLHIDAHAGGQKLVPSHGIYCTTDDEGRFDFELQVGWESPAELTIRTNVLEERLELRAFCRLGPATGGSAVDLGAVVLDDGPILAAGRVVWAVDGSATRATVKVTAVDGSGAAIGPDRLAGSGGVAEDGQFTVRAASACDIASWRVRIAVRDQSLVDTAVEGPAGRTDWLVKVHKRGVVKGRLLLEGDVVLSECTLFFGRGPAGYGQGKIDADGAFTFTDVPAGTYVVIATLRSENLLGAERTKVSIPDVVVADDTTTEDPRLLGIRLSSKFPLTEVRVTSERGGIVKGAAVRVDDMGVTPPTTDGEGSVRLRLPVLTKILVTCPGFEAWMGDATPGVTTVVLIPTR